MQSKNPVAPQDVADGLIADLVAEIRKGALDSIIAPSRVGLGEVYDQFLDLRIDTRPTGIAPRFRPVELLATIWERDIGAK